MASVMSSDGTELFVSDWGAAKSTPVLFAHAWGLSGDMWSAQVPDLIDAGLRCVTFDRRGHGRSGRHRDEYCLDVLADDVAAVVNGLNLEQVILVGHSMGAQEVLRYLSRHGTGHTAGVVLSAPATPMLVRSPDNLEGVEESVLEAQRGALRLDTGAYIDIMSTHDYFGSIEVSPHIDAWTRRQIIDTPLFVLIETHRTYTRADLRDDLAQLELPTLVIQGEADKSAPVSLTGQPTAALVRGSRLVLIEGAGHGVYASRAKRYNEELIRFVLALRV